MPIELAIQTLIVGLASGYFVTAWTDGSIFELPRDWLSKGMICARLPKHARVQLVGEKLTDLLLCPLCLSPYVSIALWAVLLPFLTVDVSLLQMLFAGFASAAISILTYKNSTLS